MLRSHGGYVMNKIVCTLNESDFFIVADSSFHVNLYEKKDYPYTFFNKKRRLYQFPKFFSNEALDLFYISLMVFYSDRMVLRKNTLDAWTRSFKIYMPVLELDKWSENKILLENTLSFLSGDRWNFEFRKRDYNEKEIQISKGFGRTKNKI